MPQWDFLNFLTAQGKRYATFNLRMLTEATALIEEGGRFAGLRARAPEGELEIRADLVVGRDGRHATVRDCAGFHVENIGAPMDVLWFRVARRLSDSAETFGHFEAGYMLVMLNRGDYWQCAYLIPKGGIDRVKEQGLSAFRDSVAKLSPFLADRITTITSWDDVKLLTVAVDRLTTWHRDRLICIGDAAHAMSPIGGVAINLAVQDAVAVANILAGPLRAGALTRAHLALVQERRALPMRIVQWGQVTIQNKILAPTLRSTERPKLPFALKFMNWFPSLRRIPARLFALGVRPEHIHAAEAAAPQ